MNFPVASPEYAGLKSLKEDFGVVYGPVQSRRLGLSLGINILGTEKKICSYDCVYCDLGPTEIRMNDLKKVAAFSPLSALKAELAEAFKANAHHKIETICISGNGEPTLHPEFEEIVIELVALRNQFFPKVRLGVLTNGSGLESRKIQRALALLDLRMIKFDAGSDSILKKLNSPLVKETLEGLIINIRKLKGVILQSLFVQGAVDNTTSEHVEEWIEAVGMIQPDVVHIYTLDRVPAQPGLLKTDEDTLYTVGAKLEKRTRVRWKAFY